MRAIRLLRKTLILIVTCVVIFYTYVNVILGDLSINSDIFLLKDISDSFLIERTSNTGITNINGLSNIYLQMKEDGWTVYKENVNNNEIDIIFTNKNGKVARVYYQCKSNEIAVFMSEYENSGLIFTYTSDKNNK